MALRSYSPDVILNIFGILAYLDRYSRWRVHDFPTASFLTSAWLYRRINIISNYSVGLFNWTIPDGQVLTGFKESN
ncbi:hypothetical protein PILCRDRAFT_812707 [Piloderma croceum F 1598]|uniref:Uncharacterized protein n=1 Tax=Piloderma croceum (strain F 1598) TaxID=765440 RepID=A0A0C3GE04_PILCF|nr:hypothetical protein PILCRDRAFT_812707 [Piloderma croceum F 1598]